MMKKTIWVLLLSVCIVFGCLAFSVQADSALQITVAADGGDYTTVESALAAVETMAKNGELNSNGVQLILSGTHTATVKSNILFGQKTIFLPSGLKLPITISGGTLNIPEGNAVCTNDYTFSNIRIPFDDVAVKLFAGSGDVVLTNVTTDLNGTAEYKSKFFADNCVASAFTGWDEDKLDLYTDEDGLLNTSMTLAHGFSFTNTSGYPYAAVGSSTDFSAKIGSKTISADDTCTKLIIDGATLHNTMARVGKNPVGNSVLHIKSGTMNHIYACNASLQSTINGDVTVLVDGGDVNDFPRLLNGSLTLNGDLNVVMKNLDLMENTVENGKMIQMAFSGPLVNGNVNVTMDNVKADRYYGALSSSKGVNGDINLTIKNSEFTKFIHGGWSTSAIDGNVTNTLENVTTGFYRGIDECTGLTGNLVTNWKNVTIPDQSADVHIYMGGLTGKDFVCGGNIFNTLEEVNAGANVCVYMGTYNGTVNGNITSTIKSGTFNDYFYGANNSGVVTGTVTNNIQGGTYDNEVYLAGFYVDLQGQLINNISGGNFQKLYLFCGSRSGKISNTKLDYAVKNYFSGGYFKGVWGGSGGGSVTHNGNIYNEITGGHFSTFSTDNSKINSFAGGPRNAKHTGNVKTVIRGGIFEGWVAGGAIPNSEDYSKTNEGNTELILGGGDFRSVIEANCRWGTYTGTTKLILDTKEGNEPLKIVTDVNCEDVISSSETYPLDLSVKVNAKRIIARGNQPLNLYGEVTTESFIAEKDAATASVYYKLNAKEMTLNGEMLNIGARTQIALEKALDTVNLHQTELWNVNTYLTSPADTVIEISESDEAFGRVEVKDGVVKGLSSAMAGVSFIFNDNVALRFAFDKEWVEAVKDNFKFTAKAGSQTIVNGATFSKLVMKDGFYTIVSDPINTVNYNQNITYSGNYLPERSFKMVDLAATGIKIYDKAGSYQELGTLLKAFSNYAIATDNYKNGKSNPLPYENAATPSDFTEVTGDMNVTSDRGMGYMTLTDTAHVTITGKQLILDDGMRIRYTLKGQSLNVLNQSKAKVHSLHFWNGCEDITSTITKKWNSSGLMSGYYTVTVDIPVYPSTFGNYVRFLVTEQATLNNSTTYVVDHIEKLDALAEEYSKTSDFGQVGSTLQYYVQASEAYRGAQRIPDNYNFPETFSAGWAIADISSYGYKLHMYSYSVGQIYIDPCYVTCLAMCDGEDLVLYYSVDTRQCDDTFTKEYKALISKEFGVDPDKIFFNATHNHSGPDTTQRGKTNIRRWYDEIFTPSILNATTTAILDLAPSELYAGKATSDPGTNYVRRYVRQSGAFTGIHVYEPDSNINTTDPVVGYESEADKELRTIRFERGDKTDIILANWQGHAAHGANKYDTQFTGDFVYWLRKGVQENTGAHFIYCNGASGNLNFTPKTQADKNAAYFTDDYFEGIGKSLVGTVSKAITAEQKINSGKFQVEHIAYNAPVKVDADDIREKAITVNEACKAYAAENGAWTSVSQQRNYIFNNFASSGPYLQSTYHLSSLITRNTYKTEGTTHLIIDIFALSFGDVAMGFVPYEQFDTNAKQMRDGVADLYKICISGGYTNGTKSYVPSNLSSIDNEAAKVHYGGYEVYTCRYEDGTGDGVAAALKNSLRNMKGAN